MTRRALPFIAVAAVVGVGLDLLIGYSPTIGYGAAIGLLGTIALTLVSKKVMAPLLQRGEDYYPEDLSPEVEHDVYGMRTDLAPAPQPPVGGDLAGWQHPQGRLPGSPRRPPHEDDDPAGAM